MARGASRSDTIQNIFKNIIILEKNNISELVLTGVNICDFGRRSSTENFFNLIKLIELNTSISRFRISSIEPNLLSTEIIQLVKNSKKFLPHFHIPMQSGSDKILSLMKRKYNTSIYENKINNIKNTVSDVCIGADVIVGFPGETENDFLDTYNFIKQLEINYLHVFSYSNRDNAHASFSDKQIPKEIRLKRSRILQNLSNEMRRNFYKKNLGKIKKVLFESTYEDNYIVGFTDNYIRVYCKGDVKMINKIYNVELLFLSEDIVYGELI